MRANFDLGLRWLLRCKTVFTLPGCRRAYVTHTPADPLCLSPATIAPLGMIFHPEVRAAALDAAGLNGPALFRALRESGYEQDSGERRGSVPMGECRALRWSGELRV